MLESPTTAPPAAGARAGLVTGVVVGVASAALGLGVAELVAGFLGRTATPVIAVGEAFIDRVPGWLKDLAVAWFGTADKAVLIAGVLVVFAVLSAGIGVLTTRRRGAGVLVAGGLGFVAIVATWTRPDTTVTDLWPALVCVIVSLIALDLLAGRAAAATGRASAATTTAEARTVATLHFYPTGRRAGKQAGREGPARYAARPRRTQPLWPPRPIAFDRATSTWTRRASFGT